jgi:hypothetical protein
LVGRGRGEHFELMHFGLERAKLAFERAGFDQKLGGTLALGLDAELETFAPRFNRRAISRAT